MCWPWPVPWRPTVGTGQAHLVLGERHCKAWPSCRRFSFRAHIIAVSSLKSCLQTLARTQLGSVPPATLSLVCWEVGCIQEAVNLSK